MALTLANDLPLRLRDLKAALGNVPWAQLAYRAGVNPKQMSEWRRGGGQRPPLSRLQGWARREGWPVEIFLENGPWPSEVVGVPAHERLHGGTEIDTPGGYNDHQPEDRGWLWAEPSQAEQQFRSLLQHLERTTRAMVGNPDLFSAEETKKYRLAVIRGSMHSAELAGRPVPEWLFRIYNEVLGGTFR